MNERASAGDAIPAGHEQIEIHVGRLEQLFHSMDPSPFRNRDLDPEAEEFIVEWAREAPRNADFALVVHLDRAPGMVTEPELLRAAVSQFFSYRATVTRRRLHQLLRLGRASLVIGLAFVITAMAVGNLISTAFEHSRVGALLRESLVIGGWVAMWRPLEIFLYDWWPIRAEARLYSRLARMPVRITYGGAAGDLWRSDWPARPPRVQQREP